MEVRPWSGEVLKKLSRHLRDGTEPPDSLPRYDDVMVWYDELVDFVITEIDKLSWSQIFEDRYSRPIGRAKTVQTLREKLQRMPSIHLPSIQDVAGIRLEMPMTLTEQDVAVKGIVSHFEKQADVVVEDLRAEPHAGYRAVHILLNFRELRGRVEVQVRTELQGGWANVYEEVGDLFGRDIRYLVLPESDERKEFVESMQRTSLEVIKELEITKNQLFLQNAALEQEMPESAEAVRKAYANIPGGLQARRDRIDSLEAQLVEQLQLMRTAIQTYPRG